MVAGRTQWQGFGIARRWPRVSGSGWLYRVHLPQPVTPASLGINSQIIALTPMGTAYTQFLFVIRWKMGEDGRKRASPYPPVKG